jgi:hydrogenase maturation protease
MTGPRILVAGIGNIFLGDDAFGVEVARELASRGQPEGVRVVDFGIRGFDLAYALQDDYQMAVLVDATPRGGPPGTLYLLEPDPDGAGEPGDGGGLVETHGMNPMKVLRLVRSLGGPLPSLRVVGCEPATLGSEEEPVMGLSEPVRAAVAEAVRIIESLVAAHLGGGGGRPDGPSATKREERT